MCKMKYSGVIYIVVTMCIYRALSKCVFDRFDIDNPPLFIMRVYDQERVIRQPHEKSITISDGAQIEVYCPYNLTLTGSDRFIEYKENQLHVACRMHKLRYIFKIATETDLESELPRLGCIQTTSVHKANSEYCDRVSMAYTMKTQFGAKLISDICYDVESMETHLIHYRTKPNGNVLNDAEYPGVHISSHEELQIDFILSNEDRRVDLVAPLFFLHGSSLPPNREQQLNKLYGKFPPSVMKSLSFRFDELVPSENLHRGYQFGLHHRALNSMLWWTALKDGNWRYVEELTKIFAESRDYDIYTGVSIEEDLSFGRNALYYRSKYNKPRIPLYVWKYVKAVSPFDTQNEIVIIGINNPYFQVSYINELVFCNDICETVDWLAQLTAIRKCIAYGYVFCCKANEAGRNIEAINKIRYAFRNEFTQNPQ